MFDKLKDLNNLRKQANELKKQLETERVTVNSGDNVVTITLNGSHEIIELKINKDLVELNADQLVGSLKQAYNQAQDELKKILAQKFQGLI